MKPLLLKIQGLNSFTDEAVIDFEKLSAKGLFGIFGPTGSGKSSIIDAITMALFGEMSRYEGSRKGGAFINSLSDTMWVYFKFVIYENGAETVYVAERSYKKNKDTQKIVFARLYKIIDEKEEIICDKPAAISTAVETLIGLGYKDFSRSVVLPQGKFSQFLLLENKDRREMLERIFGLEKYGDTITYKIKNAYSSFARQRELIQTQLEMFDNLSDETFQSEKEHLEKLTLELSQSTEKLDHLEKNYEKLKNILKMTEDLDQSEKELHQLLAHKEIVELEITKEAQGTKALLILPVYSQYTSTAQQLQKLEADLEKIKPEHDLSLNKSNQLKQRYEQALNHKNTTQPLLINKEVKLKRALEIKQTLDTLTTEVTDLRNRFKAMNGSMKEKAVSLETLQKEKQNSENITEEFSNQLRKNTITPEFRTNAGNAYRTYLTLQESKDKLNGYHTQISEYTNAVREYTRKCKNMMSELKQLETTNSDIISKLSALKENLSFTQENLLKQKEELYRFENDLQLIKTEHNKYLKTTEEFQILTDKIKAASDLINTSQKEFETNNQKLSDLQAEYMEVENQNRAALLAEALTEGDPCPVCGSVHHPTPALHQNSKNTESLKKEITALEPVIKVLENQILQNSSQLDIYKDTYIKLKAEIESTPKNIIDFNEIESLNQAKLLRDTIETYEKNLSDQNNQIKILEEKKTTADTSIQKIQMDLNKQQETVTRYEQLKLHSEKELEKIQAQIKELEQMLTEAKNRLGTENFSQLHEELLEKDQLLKELNEQYTLHQQKYSKILKDIELQQTEINKLHTEMERIKTIGSEKAALMKSYEAELHEITEGEDAAQQLTAVQNEIAEIARAERELKSQSEKAQEEFTKISDLFKSTAENIQTYKSLETEQKEKFKALLEKYEFADEKSFKDAVLGEAELGLLREKIRQYENSLNTKRSSIEILKAGLKGQDTQNIALKTQTAFNELTLLKEQITQLTVDIAVLKENLTVKENNLVKIKEFTAQLKEINTKLDILEDLVKLFEGKKFVEYAARRQLEYITKDAAKRLKDISGMRYALELDGTDFVIRDDFNGGIRRSPKTLSGGETFMASLCLALALSSKIQLTSRTSLEFFFLDEGFGSLDSDLLNTVMDSLIQLQTENIKVGIISHVEELKSQIPIKLLVSPPGHPHTGTTVYID